MVNLIDWLLKVLLSIACFFSGLGGSSPPGPTPTPTRTAVPTVAPKPPHTVAEAKDYALAKLGAAQYSCLDSIIKHEGSWNNTTVYNHYGSGAYGIPQALPGSKMAWAGTDWKTNPVTQIKWMIHYVNGRYDSACGAWRFWQNHGWY